MVEPPHAHQAMSDISTILTEFKSSANVVVRPPSGQPKWSPRVAPPDEVAEFYTLCGGVDFVEADDKTYARYRVLRPEEVEPIGGSIKLPFPVDPPVKHWYAIAVDDNDEHAAVDVHPNRSGQCYDVFHETFFEASSARIVAATFAEFLWRLYESGGPYWFKDDFVSRYFGSPASGG
jgi:antitoxin YokJ